MEEKTEDQNALDVDLEELESLTFDKPAKVSPISTRETEVGEDEKTSGKGKVVKTSADMSKPSAPAKESKAQDKLPPKVTQVPKSRIAGSEAGESAPGLAVSSAVEKMKESEKKAKTAKVQAATSEFDKTKTTTSRLMEDYFTKVQEVQDSITRFGKEKADLILMSIAKTESFDKDIMKALEKLKGEVNTASA
jgi:hypothetical protein